MVLHCVSRQIDLNSKKLSNNFCGKFASTTPSMFFHVIQCMQQNSPEQSIKIFISLLITLMYFNLLLKILIHCILSDLEFKSKKYTRKINTLICESTLNLFGRKPTHQFLSI